MYFTDIIREHALAVQPEEACGLIVQETGVYIARPQINEWEPKEERNKKFRIPVVAVRDALKSRTLVGYYHSHTKDADFRAEPSPEDKLIANEIGVPCYIYDVETDKFAVYQPTGEKPGLIGRPYVPYVYECTNLVRDYYFEKLGIELPPFKYQPESTKYGASSGIVEYFTANNFVPVSKARPFDIVLMLVKCHNYPNHAGVITEDGHLLHHLFHRVSNTCPYLGYWSKVTSVIFRHKSKVPK